MMVSQTRKLNGKRYRLSDHSLPKEDAIRLQARHKILGLNAQIKEHANGKWAVYRRCNLKDANTGKARMKRVHVNQFMIKSNLKEKVKGNRRPVISVQTSAGSIRANDVKLEGDSAVKYTPDNILSCGASVYIETKDPIVLDGCARLT